MYELLDVLFKSPKTFPMMYACFSRHLWNEQSSGNTDYWQIQYNSCNFPHISSKKKMKKGVDKRCSTSYYSMYGTLEPTGLDMIEPVNSTGAIQREIKWNKMNMRSFHALWSKLNWFYCTRGKGCQFLGPGCRVPVRCCNSFVWWSFFPMASWLQVDILGFSFKLWFLGIAFLKWKVKVLNLIG